MSKYFSTGADLQAALNALPAAKTGGFTAFDPFFYGQTYMASYPGELSPIDHFVQIGAARGYKPNATFDPTFYQNSSADLAGLDGADLLYHFMMYGLDEGRVPNSTFGNFDGTAYLAANPDVKAYVEANLAQFGGSLTNGAVAHYVKFGAAEGREASGVSSSSIFALTQGLDNIVGTSGNDTINAFAFNVVTGADTTTLQSVDTIDGGAGTDTLNIEVKDGDADAATADLNNTIQGTISNVEIVNINNAAAASAAAVDATTLGTAVQQIWQISKEAAVTKLAATTTAGFKDLATAQTLDVAPADAAATTSVAFNNVAEGSTLNVVATATGTLAAVNVSGTVADTNANGTVANTNVAVTVGKDVQTLAVNSAVATNLTITDGAGTKKVTTIDASASTGAITYADTETTLATVTTGSGKDDVTVVTATSKTAGSVVNASVTTNAGDDKVTVNVTGDGNTTINTGADNDTVAITGRGTSVLTVNLGDGADTFTSGVAIAATDTIDAGAGSDTLLLSLVGAANVGAFKNFDVYDVKGMAANLDLDILNTNNAVTEIVGSGALGAAVTLQNVGAGVNFRATADMVFADNATIDADEVLTLTQKTAGALTVTLDADETGTADATTDDVAGMTVAAAGATSVSAVFDTSYLAAAGAVAGETAATNNVSTIALATQAAASISVVSGGANAKNVLNVTEGAGTDALTTVTVTGAQALTLSVSDASKLATIDASAATGGLTAALADLKDGGTIKLGSSGTDVITAKGGATGSNAAAGAESIEGFAKTAAVSVSVAAADATAKAAAIAAADKIVIDTASDVDEAVADASTSTLAATLANGVLTFTGAGPATLDAALVIADDFAETVGETVAFQYLGNTYLFTQGATHEVGTTAAVTNADVLVKLVGVTGVTDLVETGTDTFFVV